MLSFCSLHRHLIDHLNAEIGLGTVSSASSAKKWLSGTFLYVRLKDNPEHYKIDGDTPGRNLDERLEHICSKGIAMLEENDLVCSSPKLHCTEFGEAMARYYLQFETMKIFLALSPKSKTSEILSAISHAAEFSDIRFRAGEKNTYKDLNKNTLVKFPIPVNLDASAHKVSLVIQSVLGAVDFPTEDHKHRMEYNTAKAIIFQHAHRLVRCIIDCQLYLEDAVTTRNALMLARSLGAQVWDDLPLHMKQLDGVGLVAVRKLASAGMKSIEDLENTEAHQIEQALSRHPPFGSQIQEKARAFPKLRVSIKMVGEPFIKKGEHVTVKVKAEIGFLNERVPEVFQKKPVYVCLLAETSDGHKVHFARTSAKKLSKGQDVLFTANLSTASQSITTYVMCDEIAGTMRYAILKPEIPPLAFPQPRSAPVKDPKSFPENAPNTSKRRASAIDAKTTGAIDSDEFGDDDLDDADLARAEAGGFVDIDDFEDDRNESGKPNKKKQKTTTATASNEEWEPQQLPNGKWACNHACKNKTACKHLCCREGVDKKPKPPKPKGNKKAADAVPDPKQTQLSMSTKKMPNLPTPATTSVERTPADTQRKTDESREFRDLNRLHNSVKTKTPKVPVLGQGRMGNKASQPESKDSRPRLSFLKAARRVEADEESSDYGTEILDTTGLPGMPVLGSSQPASHMSSPRHPDDIHPADADVYDAMNSDIDQSPPVAEGNGDGLVDFSSYADENDFGQEDTWNFDDLADDDFGLAQLEDTKPAAPSKLGKGNKSKHLFVGYSTDSAAEELALKPKTPGQTYPIALGQHTSVDKVFTPQETLDASQDFPPAPSREEAEYLERILPANDFLVDVAEGAAADEAAEQEDPASDPDSLEMWFKAEFGTEHFNITF